MGMCDGLLPEAPLIRDDDQSVYRLTKLIGVGSSGLVYKGRNERTGRHVAVKLESKDARQPRVFYEAKVYKALSAKRQKLSKEKAVDQVSFPTVHWHGSAGDYNAMVMDLLGPTLEDIFIAESRVFQFKTISKLGSEILENLKHVHSRGFVHRDVQPENFVVSIDGRSTTHLIDFGFAKKYRDQAGHIPCVSGKRSLGNMFFSSYNAHIGLQQSRRDDLESAAYMLLYFSQGALPWMATIDEEYISELKGKSLDVLFKDAPTELKEFLRYCRKLKFDETPDYAFLRRLIVSMGNRSDEKCGVRQYNFVVDWTFCPASSAPVEL
jgi:serine/threonine protein kinase